MFSAIGEFISKILLRPIKKFFSKIWGRVSKKRYFHFRRRKTRFRQSKDITEWTETETEIQLGSPELLEKKKRKEKKQK